MKKTLKLLLSSAMLIVLIAGMQMTAFATVVVPQTDDVSRQANDVAASPGTLRTTADPNTPTDPNAASRPEADRQNNVTEADIYPISNNPQTGAGNLAVPAALALLAASTAAVALCTKKNGK